MHVVLVVIVQVPCLNVVGQKVVENDSKYPQVG